MIAHLWPACNAALNATSAVLLVSGWFCIRAKRIVAHQRLMSCAFVTSTLFFLSYVSYHARVGTVHFVGTGMSRPIYFAILISHTILAVIIVPLVLRTLWLARRDRITEHRIIARWTLPLWLYVSITGVIVYRMLYQL